MTTPTTLRRVTVAERRLICCYQSPAARRGCHSCRHVVTRTIRPDCYDEATELRCGKHDFSVVGKAICADHEE